MKLYLLPALAIALTACQTTSRPIPPRYQLSYAEAVFSHAAVRSVLKDPSSAEFLTVFAKAYGPEHVYICGTLNARNSFGAYGGERHYYLEISNASRVIGDIEVDDHRGRAYGKCADISV